MSGGETYYITTPIYYVNDKPHIGHAYTTLACDVLARFKRLGGTEVKFLTGTDEHGQKVEKSALAAGLSPQALVDANSANFRDLASHIGASNDDFIRTTEPRHIAACQDLWRRLIEGGHIYLGHYEGWYSVRDEAFYGSDEVTTGPSGDKVGPTGAPVEWVKEPSYFFRLSAWQDRLLAYYEANPDCIAPQSRRNEVISFVKRGLQDVSVSRTSFSWGIPVPNDPDHIMYVWLDALTNYIAALGFPRQDGDYARFWPADLHMVGKDILRFHAVYWPAFLLAADLEPPKRIFAHGWWTNEGQKISKSLGNVIDPLTLIAKYGLDQVRYFLLRELPFGNDGDFSHRAMVSRMNSDLANDYGNLAQRVLSMIGKNCGGKVPQAGPLIDADEALLAGAYGMLAKVREALDQQLFHEGLETIWTVIRAANAYVDHQAPWALKKSDPARMETVLWVLAETVRLLALMTLAYMPDASARLLDQLAVATDKRDFSAFRPEDALAAGVVLPSPAGVFPRYVDAEGEG